MALRGYFEELIRKVEAAGIDNGGKDANGFYQPTRTLLDRHLVMLRDLCDKPRAGPLLKPAWQFVVENLPPELLVLSPQEKMELKNLLG